MVVERRRRPGELDAFEWYCQACGERLYQESFQLENIGTQFPPIFERFYGDAKNTTCKKCGVKLERPELKKATAADASACPADLREEGG